MTPVGVASQEPVPCGTSSPQGQKSLAEFEQLALPLFDSLYNFARWLANDHSHADAEDLVQEAYLRALRAFASFRPGTNFRAWMFRILKNAFLSSCTTLEYRLTVAIDLEDGGPELAFENQTPETILVSCANSQLIENAIEALPLHYRETLLLCDVEEMSYLEISEALSIPIGTVMSRLARARKRVREHLDDVAVAPASRRCLLTQTSYTD
jgi:RNA polymerase sigma factor (sigma-70 family)